MKIIDQSIEHALIALNDRICSWERDTGRRYTLILIPHQDDEDIQASQDGKPLPLNNFSITPQRLLEIALNDRS